jgi:uncharacterized membrane protein
VTVTREQVRRASPYVLAALLTATGIAHFAVPGSYVKTIPRQLPWPAGLVYASGVAELACAALVATPATRHRGGLATAALFVAVFPANVQMALDGGIAGSSGPLGSATVAWLRLPLQVPLVLWALAVARSGRREAQAPETARAAAQPVV